MNAPAPMDLSKFEAATILAAVDELESRVDYLLGITASRYPEHAPVARKLHHEICGGVIRGARTLIRSGAKREALTLLSLGGCSVEVLAEVAAGQLAWNTRLRQQLAKYITGGFSHVH
jgi:hypothetical protein